MILALFASTGGLLDRYTLTVARKGRIEFPSAVYHFPGLGAGLNRSVAPPEHLRRPGAVREARRIRLGWFGSLGDLRWLETNR